MNGRGDAQIVERGFQRYEGRRSGVAGAIRSVRLGERPGHTRPRSTGPHQDLPGDRGRDRLPSGGRVRRDRRLDPRRHSRAGGGRRLSRLLRLHHPGDRAVLGAGAPRCSCRIVAMGCWRCTCRPRSIGHLSDCEGHRRDQHARPRHPGAAGPAPDRLHGRGCGTRRPRRLAAHALPDRVVRRRDTPATLAAVSMAASSLTDRRAFAAIGIVLLVLASPILAAALVDGAELSPSWRLIDISSVPFKLVFRIFDQPGNFPELSTWSVLLSNAVWTLGGSRSSGGGTRSW